MEPAESTKERYLDLSRLKRAEYIGFAGSGTLFLSLLLPWFKTSETNPNSVLDGRSGGEGVNAWQIFTSLDLLLAAACTAPFVLAWLIVRGHELTWRPGEITMIVGITALMLIVLNGVVLGKPGDTVEISFSYGYAVALLGAGLITTGGVLRQAEGGRPRKAPGSL